jgi:PAS domain S-box-containing protein
VPTQQRRLWSPRRWMPTNPWMIVAIGLTATIFLFFSQREKALEDFRLEFGKKVAAQFGPFHQGIDGVALSIKSLTQYFQGSAPTDYAKLDILTSRLHFQYRDLQSLIWLARVEGGQRADFEEGYRRQGAKDFRVKELDARGHAVSARRRTVYYPITYADTFWENKGIIGFDAASNEGLRLALEQARITESPVMTKLQKLVQKSIARDSFLIVFPVYPNYTPPTFKGHRGQDRPAFVLAILKVAPGLSTLLSSSDLEGSLVEFSDSISKTANRPWYQRSMPFPASPSWWKFYLFRAEAPHILMFRPGIESVIKITPGPLYVQQNRRLSHWLILSVGFISTLFLTFVSFYLRKGILDRGRSGRSAPDFVAGIRQPKDRLRGLLWEEAENDEEVNTALIRRTAFLEALVESNYDGVLAIDSEGKRILRNRRTRQLWKLSENADADGIEAWKQHVAAHVLHPEQLEERERHLDQRPNEGLQDEIELIDGTVLERHSFPVLGKDGTYYGRIQVFRDITKLVETERALRWNTAFLEAVINSSHDGILVVDRERKRVFRNRKALELLNLPHHDPETNEDEEWDESLSALVSYRKRLDGKVVAQDGRLYENIHDELELGNGLVFERYSSPVLGADGTRYGEILFFHDITERKRAEDALRRNESTLRAAFSSSPVGIILGNANGTIEWINSSMIAMTGHALEEIKGREVATLCSSEKESERVSKIVLEEIWLGNSGAADTKWVRNDDTVIDVHVSAAAIDSKNRASGVVLTATDITERKRAEEALRESEERYRIAIENSNDGIVLAKGPKLLFANQKFLQIFGYEHFGQVMYLEDFAMIHPDDRERVATFNEERMAGKPGPDRYEARGVRRDGTVIDVEAVVAKVNHRGEPVALVYFRDITEHKAAELALRESENKFRDLAEKSVVGVYLIQRGLFAYVNARFAEICGYGVIELNDLKGPADIVLADDLPGVLSTEKARKLGQTDAINDEFRIVTKQGEIRSVEIYSSYTSYRGRRAIIGTLVDVTERKTTEKKLQDLLSELESKNRELENAYDELKTSQKKILQQEKMASIGQLAAGVAHEINNPMGFIMSNLDSLQRYMTNLPEFVKIQSDTIEMLSRQNGKSGLTYASEKREALDIDYILEDTPSLIKESLEGANRVKQIVTDLTKFSRIDETRYAQADLNRVLDSTLNIVGNELKYKATVKKAYGTLPSIMCNEGQLSQVFMNLLVNASQAMEDFGEIEIRTWEEGGYVHVTIADSGCGIPEDQLNRIFEPFFTTKEIGKGTGLGLSIAYDVVKKHNGEIEATSTEGKGTTFTVRIPIGTCMEAC